MTSSSTTPSEMPPTPQTVRAALDEATAAIDTAQTMLRQGTLIDLTGLESHVEQACGAIAELAPADREGLKPILIRLIDALNALTGELTRQHEEIGKALQDIGSRREALNAYTPRRK